MRRKIVLSEKEKALNDRIRKNRYLSGQHKFPIHYLYIVTSRRGKVKTVVMEETQFKASADTDNLKRQFFRKTIAIYPFATWEKMDHFPVLVDPFTVMIGDEVLFKMTDPRWVAHITLKLMNVR